MKLLIIDNHELFRAGLKLMLSGLDSQIEFFESSSIAEAEVLLGVKKIDLVLMDFHHSRNDDRDELLVLKEKVPEATFVIISGDDNPSSIQRLIEAGAAGFIPKRSSQAVMLAALKLVMVGGVYLPPCAFPAIHQHHSVGVLSTADRFSVLSGRQQEIVRQAIIGKSNKIIARDLGIAEATVKAHLSGAYRQLGVRNRTEAVFMAAQTIGNS